MPSKHDTLANVRGEEAYGKFLDRLHKEAAKRGYAIEPGRPAILELAANLLAFGWGIKAPQRVAKEWSRRPKAD